MELYNVIAQTVNAFTYLYLCYMFYSVFFKRRSSVVTTVVYKEALSGNFIASIVSIKAKEAKEKGIEIKRDHHNICVNE